MLFENENYDVYNMDLNFLNLNPKYNESNNEKLFDKKEGFLKGNMFVKEYDPYKNYQPSSINPQNKKEEIALKLYSLDFAINDLNLYLDLHPEDTKMFELFKKYLKEMNQVREEYIEMYGPLTLTDVTSFTYDWINRWPWERGGNF